MKTLFFTGATGAIAPFLIHRFLHGVSEVERFVCLVRQRGGPERLARRIEALCPDCARLVEPPRFVFVAGDVTDPIPDSIPLDSIWHFAGDLRMDADSEEEVLAVNLGGMRHVLDLCRRTGATLHDVSTAYVCGTREGRVLEGDLNCGQSFRNAYESSKAKAEELVREHLQGAPGMVFRPSIVLGDSGTGVTLTFAGFYRVLWAALRLHDRLADLADAELQIPLPCASREEPVNLVAAEYVTDLLDRLHRDERSLGRTFHVVNPQPPSIGEILDVIMEVIGKRGLRLVPKGSGQDYEDARESARDLGRTIGDHVMVYFPYLAGSHPEFDMGNVAEIFGGVPPHPTLDHAAWQRLFRYAVERDFAAVY
jgi:nucleoside-diphosphate-sugar epimerase